MPDESNQPIVPATQSPIPAAHPQPTPAIPNAVAPPSPLQIIQHPKIIYINFYDGINEAKVKTLMSLLSDVVARQKPETLYFLFSSPGGAVGAGIVLYNFLKALPVEIVMHNTGSVDSIGTVIFLAGAKRYAAVHSSFFISWRSTELCGGWPIKSSSIGRTVEHGKAGRKQNSGNYFREKPSYACGH